MALARQPARPNNIGIDIDNVLCDTDDILRELIKQEYGIEVAQSEIVHWNYSDSVNISPKQEKRLLDLFHKRYCAYVEAIPGAREALEILSKSYSIWLLTGRSKVSDSLTREWLRKNNILFNVLIYSDAKYKYSDQLSILMEDNWATAKLFADRGVPAILFEKPWNLGFPAHLNVIRVLDWNEALSVERSLRISQRKHQRA